MIYLEYKDFTELYHELSRFPIHHEDDFGDFGNDYFNIGASQYINNLIVKTSSHSLEGPQADLSNFNYTIAKWTTLINKYIDKEDYFLLKERLATSTAKTLTFNFKIHVGLNTDKDQTKNRDSCIIALVFSRNGNKGPWTIVNIFYRVCEIYKKFACDLMLLNRMFEDLPNLDLQEYLFHIPQPFFSTFIMCELIDSYDFRKAIAEIANRKFTDALNSLARVPSYARKARWYYISAVANYGAGNTVQASADIQKAVNEDPGNQTYRAAYQQINRSSQAYQRNARTYQSSFGGIGSLCCSMALSQMLCGHPCFFCFC